MTSMTMTEKGTTVRVGTRGSALAVRQTEWVAGELRRRRPGLSVEIVRIRTSGDHLLDRTLSEIGGKGLFVKEIEEALLGGRIDLAVHSMKDMPASLASGLTFAAVPAREDPSDVLIARSTGGLAALPRGARIGTASLRRAAFVYHARPDVEVTPLRGNVDTRISRWRTGDVDALVLAAAGLHRLGLRLPEARALATAEMLPAIGQGALAIEARLDGPWLELGALLDDAEARVAILAERAFLQVMGGDCTMPIAAHAIVSGQSVELDAAIAEPSGRRLIRGSRRGGREAAEALGATLASEILERGGREIVAGLRR
jgi:hydroxymethylbilane synthase